jgi:hypothetical protein
MKRFHDIERLAFKGNVLLIRVDGNEYELDLSNVSKKLANASSVERENFEISPSGYGIHWPLLDEDISIDGLLGIKHSPMKLKQKIAI